MWGTRFRGRSVFKRFHFFVPRPWWSFWQHLGLLPRWPTCEHPVCTWLMPARYQCQSEDVTMLWRFDMKQHCSVARTCSNNPLNMSLSVEVLFLVVFVVECRHAPCPARGAVRLQSRDVPIWSGMARNARATSGCRCFVDVYRCLRYRCL